MDPDLLKKYYKNYNDSVANLNDKLFGFKTFDLPKISNESSIEENWNNLFNCSKKCLISGVGIATMVMVTYYNIYYCIIVGSIPV